MDANVIEVSHPVEVGIATFYHEAVIDGVAWKRDDLFYVRDHYGVPRPVTFKYVIDGVVVCYSRQRFRIPGGGVQPCGFTSRLMPSRSAVDMDPVELEFRQIAADLVDIGEHDEAERLTSLLAETGDADQLEAAKKRALKIIDAASEDES